MIRIPGLLLFLIGTVSHLFAQTITGTVVMPTGEPLAAATATILRADSILITSFSTDSKGSFNKKISESSFTVRISYIGYQTRWISVQNNERKPMDLGVIPMQEEQVEMNSVSVTANQWTEYVDRMVVIPSAEQVKSSSDGLGLLNSLHLPGLFIDEISQKVRIDGTSSVVYKINDIPVKLDRVIALRPEQVLRIEYAQDPSARYLSSNAGVINIILRKDRPGTYVSGNLLGALSTGFVNGRLTGSAIYDRSEIRVGYNMNWRDYARRGQYQENTYKLGEKVYEEFQTGHESPMGYLYHKLHAGYTYQYEKSALDITVSAEIVDGWQRNRADIRLDHSDTPLYGRAINLDMESIKPEINVYYIYKKDRYRGFEANLIARYSNEKEDRNLYDYYQTGDDYELLTHSREKVKSVHTEFYYYNNTNKLLSYQVGLKNSGQFFDNSTGGSEKEFRRIETYPYAGLSGKVKKFSYQLGTGLRYTSTKREGETYGVTQNVSNLMLLYAFPWGTLRNSTRYGNGSPSISSLNSTAVQENKYIIREGNPDLKSYSRLSNRSTLTLNIRKNVRWMSGVFFQKTYKPIHSVYLYEPEKDLLVRMPMNSDYDSRLNLNSSIQWKSIFDIFSVSAGIDWNDYRSAGADYKHRFDNLSWSMQLSAVYKDISLNASYRKPAKALSGQTINSEENNSSIGFLYKRKTFTVGAGIYYPFERGTEYRSWSLDKNARNSRYTYIKDNANMVYLRASFTFSSGKPLFNIKRNLSGDESDSSLIRISD